MVVTPDVSPSLLPATIELKMFIVPPFRWTTALSETFRLTVTWRRVDSPVDWESAAPTPALLPARVTFSSVIEPSLKMPPPESVASLLSIVDAMMVIDP